MEPQGGAGLFAVAIIASAIVPLWRAVTECRTELKPAPMQWIALPPMLRIVAWDLLFAGGAAVTVYFSQKTLPVSFRQDLYESNSTLGKFGIYVAVGLAAATTGAAGGSIARVTRRKTLHAAFKFERHRLRILKPENPRFQAVEALADVRDDWMRSFAITEAERLSGRGIAVVASVVRTHLRARNVNRPIVNRTMGKQTESLSLALRDLESMVRDTSTDDDEIIRNLVMLALENGGRKAIERIPRT